MTARVVWWDVDRGHGFLRDSGGEDVFVHHTAIVQADGCTEWRGELNLPVDAEVEFDPTAGTVGTVAANVRVIV